MAKTNSATLHHASKPSAMSHTKVIASCNIDLDENEENIIPEQTRTDCPCSTKQAQMGKLSHIATSSLPSLVLDQEALDKEMATLSKRLKVYQKTKWQQEKSL